MSDTNMPSRTLQIDSRLISSPTDLGAHPDSMWAFSDKALLTTIQMRHSKYLYFDLAQSGYWSVLSRETELPNLISGHVCQR